MSSIESKVGGYETQTLELKIEGTPEALKTLVNLLGAIQYNTNVGHSCTMGAFFDGDGADKISIQGLPENHGKEMADACGDWGDGLMVMIGPDVATAYNTTYTESGDQIVKRTTCWPPEKTEKSVTSFLSRARNSK